MHSPPGDSRSKKHRSLAQSVSDRQKHLGNKGSPLSMIQLPSTQEPTSQGRPLPRQARHKSSYSRGAHCRGKRQKLVGVIAVLKHWIHRALSQSALLSQASPAVRSGSGAADGSPDGVVVVVVGVGCALINDDDRFAFARKRLNSSRHVGGRDTLMVGGRRVLCVLTPTLFRL
jgi:hypothetical protein